MNKKYFFVNFQWYSGNVYCSNIAHAESVESVEKEYSKYPWHSIRDVTSGELEMARSKGMPIIEL